MCTVHGDHDLDQQATLSSDCLSSRVHMAVVWHQSTIGIAWYDEETNELEVLQGADESCGPLAYQLLQLALHQVPPRIVYVPSTCDVALLKVLQHCNFANSPMQEDAVGADGHSMVVRTERAGLFQRERALLTLQQVQVHGLTDDVPRAQDRLARLNTVLNLSSTQQVCAAGGLLSILSRDGVLGGTESGADDTHTAFDGASMRNCVMLSSIRETNLQGYLQIDGASLHALQVFAKEGHPSAMGLGAAKEGLSLFGLMGKCVTPMGRKLLRFWFLRPLINMQVLSQRQQAIQLFLDASDLGANIRTVLRHIKDVTRIIRSKLLPSQGLPDLSDYRSLLSSVEAMMQLHASLAQLAAELYGQQVEADSLPDVLVKGLTWLAEAPFECRQLIYQVLQSSEEEGVGGELRVAAGLSEELDRLRETYETLPEILTQVVEQELQRTPRMLLPAQSSQLWAMVYMPQVGFVMRLEGSPLSAAMREYLADYELAFEGATEDGPAFFYKCTTGSELDDAYGDLLHKIRDLERSVCCELLAGLQHLLPDLSLAVATVAELDCLLALAESARAYRLCRPTLSSSNELHIVGGRDLVTELVVERYIPNDCSMTQQEGRIQVLTGPNGSGKTCYMRQVASIVFLAHIGSYVPAEQAVVGLTDRILTRMAGPLVQGAVHQSSFSADLTQMATILKLSTVQSLCLMDEFGKGTLPEDGAGLLAGCLHYLAQRPQGPPKVIAGTHFIELGRHRILPQTSLFSYLTMDCVMDSQAPAGSLSPTFLFRVVPGWSPSSYGLACANLAGLPPAVLQRAQQVLHWQEGEAQLPAADTEYQDKVLGAKVALLQRLQATDINSAEDMTRFLTA